MILRPSSRCKAVALAAAVLLLMFADVSVSAQALSVLPVNVFLAPGQKATSLAITNSGKEDTAIQIRVYKWSQQDNDDKLTETNEVVVSPPLAKLAPDAQQVVRFVLRHAPQQQEATYRIIIDQIPPPGEPGVVKFVIRLSIPVFALPPVKCAAKMQFSLERTGDDLFLVATNSGTQHEAVRNIELTAADGRKLKLKPGTLPYVLPGNTRRWPIATEAPIPSINETLRLSAQMTGGAVAQQVSIVEGH